MKIMKTKFKLTLLFFLLGTVNTFASVQEFAAALKTYNKTTIIPLLIENL